MIDSCKWARKLNRYSCVNDCPFPICLMDINEGYLRERQALYYIAKIENKVLCPYCKTTEVSKYGISKGVQLYWCKECRRKFRNNGCDINKHYKVEHYSMAIELKREGLTVNEIVKRLQDITGKEFPLNTVYSWLIKEGIRTYKVRCDKVN